MIVYLDEVALVFPFIDSVLVLELWNITVKFSVVVKMARFSGLEHDGRMDKKLLARGECLRRHQTPIIILF